MKKYLCLIIAFLFAIALAGCGSSNSESVSQTDAPVVTEAPTTLPEFDLDAFKTAVSDCRQDINDASIFIANMGTYEFKYWKALGSLSDDIAEKGYEWLAKNSDATKESVEASYESIRQQYKEITLTEYTGKEAEEIYAAIDAMYRAYNGMYNLVNSPSGSLSDFGSELSDYIDAIQESESDLELFLE